MKRTAIAVLVLAVVLGGCSVEDRAELIRVTRGVRASITHMTGEKAELENALKYIPPGEKREEAKERLAATIAYLEKAEATLGELENAENELDAADTILQGVSQTVPAPWGALIGVLGGSIVMGIRAYRTKQVAKRVIASTEGFMVIDAERKELLDAKQGKAGKALVDEAQGKKRGLPF